MPQARKFHDAKTRGEHTSGNLALAPADAPARPGSLVKLKALISNHQALLAGMRRRNEMLEGDNALLEHALADLSPDGVDDGHSLRVDDVPAGNVGR